ncbi:hypothetical protein BDD39_001749 [Saccharococcus thermophilus]|jgi:hypothetical protein|uniref:Uncharacterized protein n=1 Tax=Saccharococcus thermophilus TaxID=29396 RepID=A0A846MGF2_9BACL|nr:hypothetical protein [Saccharococcus thermophilus]
MNGSQRVKPSGWKVSLPSLWLNLPYELLGKPKRITGVIGAEMGSFPEHVPAEPKKVVPRNERPSVLL